ncbi:MAG: hypothetical protein QM765_13510 [Myxococcales bacterium]
MLWAQLLVSSVGDTLVEVGHLDATPGDDLWRNHRELPLADGSLRVEVGPEVYTIPAP